MTRLQQFRNIDRLEDITGLSARDYLDIYSLLSETQETTEMTPVEVVWLWERFSADKSSRNFPISRFPVNAQTVVEFRTWLTEEF